MTMQLLGQVLESVASLEIDVKGALVTIRHEEREDIEVRVNNPDNWKLNGGFLHQSKVQQPLGGGTQTMSGGSISIGGSIQGSVVSGRSISIGGSIKGNVISCNRGRTVVNACGSEESMTSIEVRGGSTTQPMSVPSNSGPDRLEVVVPNTFRGNLSLNYEGGSTVDLDKWQGGEVAITASGADSLKAGPLMGIDSFVLQCTGGGDFEFEEIYTKSFRVAKTGSADLVIDELQTESLLLTQTGSGDTKIRDGFAAVGSVNGTGSGDVTMRGAFAQISQSSIGSGEVKIKVRQ